MAKKKKLLVYIHQSILKGGVEKVFYNLFNNLPGDEYEITVLNYVAYLTDDLDKIRYKGQKRRLWFLYDEFSQKPLKRFCQRVHNKLMPIFIPLWLKLQHFDIAIAAQEGMYAKFVDENVRADKKLLWIHNDMLLCRFTEQHFDSHAAEKACYDRFDHVVCVSGDVERTMRERFGEMSNLCVCYNPIDTLEIDEALKEPAPVRPQLPLFVCVGRLVEQKGFDRLLEACDRLNKEGFSYHVWIVGEGSDRPVLEHIISENNLQNVTLWGNQTNPFVFMRQADWLLCTSRHEGFNLVLHEAVCCGVPILTTLNAGAVELLEDSRYGMIMDNNTDSIYQGMKQVLVKPELRDHYLMMVRERRDFVNLEKRINRIQKLL